MYASTGQQTPGKPLTSVWTTPPQGGDGRGRGGSGRRHPVQQQQPTANLTQTNPQRPFSITRCVPLLPTVTSLATETQDHRSCLVAHQRGTGRQTGGGLGDRAAGSRRWWSKGLWQPASRSPVPRTGGELITPIASFTPVSFSLQIATTCLNTGDLRRLLACVITKTMATRENLALRLQFGLT